jgi:hypothetical protein
MKKVIPAIVLVVSFAFAVVGCQESTGADTSPDLAKNTTKVGENGKKANGGKPDLGTATMTQGISDSEASNHVGSAGK